MGSNTQYAWGEDETVPLEGVVDVLSTISTDEWEELIQCIFKKCDESVSYTHLTLQTNREV